jgi:hypothetical protein
LHGFFLIKMDILGKYPFKQRIGKVVGTISTAEFPGRILQKTLRRRNNPGDLPSPGGDFPERMEFPAGGFMGHTWYHTRPAPASRSRAIVTTCFRFCSGSLWGGRVGLS